MKNRTNTKLKEARTANSTYKKLADQCSAEAFVANQSLLLRIAICDENRQLLVAATRYVSPQKTTRAKDANYPYYCVTQIHLAMAIFVNKDKL